MTSLFRWPAAAQVDRELSKERLYAEGRVSAPVRRRFIDEVQRVRWAYKLGEESVHLAGTDEVPEVQVFEIELKGDGVSDAVLASIDKAVPSPIIFELRRTRAGCRELQSAAAQKRHRQKSTTVSDYLRSEWTVELSPREPLPPAIDLPGLYTQLMFTLLPTAPRRGEGLAAALERVSATRRLQREIGSLNARMQREPQFNRKVALRHELKARQTDLDALLGPTPPAPES